MTTPKEVIEFAKENDAVMVDLKFIDFLGTWQHMTVPVGEMTEDMLEEGRMFDGSSMRCWQGIENSDMKVVPDLSTVKMDPFYEHPTLSVICDIQDPVTGEDYSRDPRAVTKKAEKYLVLPELETQSMLVRKQNFFCLMMCVSHKVPKAVFIPLILRSVPGILVQKKWAEIKHIKLDTSLVIFRQLHLIRIVISEQKWC